MKTHPNIVVATAQPRIVIKGFTTVKIDKLPYIDPDSPEYESRPPGNMGRAKDPFGQARVWRCSRATGVYRKF